MPNRLIFQTNKNDVRKLTNKLKSLEKFAKTDVDRIMNNEAERTIDRMQRSAPVDTGRLRREIDFVHLGKGIEFYSEAIDPETNEDYAPLQEFGTRYFRAQPYFYKNIRKFTKNLRNRLANRIQDIIIRNKK